MTTGSVGTTGSVPGIGHAGHHRPGPDLASLQDSSGLKLSTKFRGTEYLEKDPLLVKSVHFLLVVLTFANQSTGQ